MTVLDLIVLAATISAVVAGFRLGLVARAISWAGLALGFLLASWALPRILDPFPETSEIRLFFAAVGVLIGGAVIGQAFGLFLGGRARVAIPAGPGRVADQVAGGIAGAVGVVLALWLLLPTMATVPGWPAEQARNSTVARAVVDVLPDAPDTFRALRQLVGEDRFPQVFAALDPAPDLGDPPAATGIAPGLSARITDSVVRIEARACGRIQEGSGFVAGPELVVTNAHVAAGAEGVEVVRTDGSRLAGTLVGLDPDQDLAAVRVPGLDRPALPVGAAVAGDGGGVYGFPGGGPLRIAPFEVARPITATGADIYDRDRTRRDILILSAALRPGDSGSAVVSTDGEVVGVAFAIAPDRNGVAYALDEGELGRFLNRDLSTGVDSGPCVG